MSTNIRTVLLLAYLLCAEAPNGTLEERWLIAQTVVYRLEARGLTIEQVIYTPQQYQGVGLIDADAYRRLRRQELEENFAIALAAILMGPVARVSNFAEPNSADWQSRCELKHIVGKHHFYLCPDWRTQMAKEKKPNFKEMKRKKTKEAAKVMDKRGNKKSAKYWREKADED